MSRTIGRFFICTFLCASLILFFFGLHACHANSRSFGDGGQDIQIDITQPLPAPPAHIDLTSSGRSTLTGSEFTLDVVLGTPTESMIVQGHGYTFETRKQNR